MKRHSSCWFVPYECRCCHRPSTHQDSWRASFEIGLSLRVVVVDGVFGAVIKGRKNAVVLDNCDAMCDGILYSFSNFDRNE